MSLNGTPSAERIHIGIFGRRNAGKSSIINAITNQELAIVAEIAGTTTDPVSKTMELLPLGPVVLIDTPGIDDEGTLGEMRVKKSYQVLNKTDLALLVVDGPELAPEDQKLLERIQKKEIPFVIAYNKCDLWGGDNAAATTAAGEREIAVSAEKKIHIEELKELLAAQQRPEKVQPRICGDLLKPGDLVVLVVPIDESAPKGRLILPQQQTIRDILDADASAVVVKDTGLKPLLQRLGTKPAMVITDSQAFSQVAADTPVDVPLTSFSILMARHKGILEQAVQGISMIEQLKDGDKVLISEGCTHHRQCNDIGSVKIPGWLQKYSGAKLDFVFTSGTEFPADLSPYRLIVHCGGCMLNEREMQYRMKCAEEQGVPMTNYGMMIAYVKGILDRSMEPLRKR